MALFIAESHRGVHRIGAELIGARLAAFTFLPGMSNVNKPIESVYYDVNIFLGGTSYLHIDGVPDAKKRLVADFGRNIVKMLLSLLERDKDKTIYLGHDLDAMGQLMASLLYYHFVGEGVPRHDIYRVPLTEVGFDVSKKRGEVTVGFGEFYTEAEIHAVLEAYRRERQFSLSHKAGYRRLCAAERIAAYKRNGKSVLRLNEEGTGLSTYLVKAMLEEERQEGSDGDDKESKF